MSAGQPRGMRVQSLASCVSLGICALGIDRMPNLLGAYSDKAKSAACILCPAGKFANESGASACDLNPYCIPGYYAEITVYHGESLEITAVMVI